MSSSAHWIASQNRHPLPWFLLLAGLLALQISPAWFATPDSVYYLSTARSIAQGNGLTSLGSSQLAFPPGYPLLISPAFLLGARPFLAIAMMHWALAVLLMLGVFRWSRVMCPEAALLLTALVVVNVSLWVHYRRPLSELAFMTTLVWTVHLLNRTVAADSTRAALRAGVPAVLLAIFLSLIREVGGVVSAGFAAAVVLRARRDAAFRRRAWTLAVTVLAPTLIVVVGFTVYESRLRAASRAPMGTHLDGFVHIASDRVPQLVEGLRLRISEVGRLLLSGMFKAYARPGRWLDINLAIYVPVFVATLIGWWRLVRRRTDVFALTLPFYFLAYVAWPFDGATRYLLPMLPVLLVSLYVSAEPLHAHRLTLLSVLLAGHLTVALVYWLVMEIPRARVCNATWPAAEAVVTHVHGSAQPFALAASDVCLQLQIAFLLDRPVAAASASVPLDARVQWLVVARDTAAPPDFGSPATAGEFVIFARSGAP